MYDINTSRQISCFRSRVQRSITGSATRRDDVLGGKTNFATFAPAAKFDKDRSSMVLYEEPAMDGCFAIIYASWKEH